MPDNTAPATEVDEADPSQQRFLVLTESISKARLEQLSIRIVAEADLRDLNPSDPPLQESYPVFVITKTGIEKLRKYSYDTSKRRNLSQGNYVCVLLQNPDGTPAKADVDPATIKVITFTNFHGQNWLKEFLRTLLRDKLQPVIGKNIEVGEPEVNRTVAPEPSDSNLFRVRICSSPEGGEYHTPPTIFGHRVPNTDNLGLGIWYGGTPISAPEGEIGAFDANNLYVYPYLTQARDTSEPVKAIFTAIIDFVVERLRNPGAKLDLADIKSRYIKACAARSTEEIKDCKKIIDVNTDNVRKAQESIIQMARQVQNASKRLVALEHGNAEFDKILGDEFDAILKMPKIKGIDWRGTKFIVKTDVMYCVDPRTKKVHEIGAFNIMIDVNIQDLIFTNLTRKVSGHRPGMNGPHLFPNGRACLGNMEAVIPRMVAAYQWRNVVVAALQFIESVNVDDAAGAKIDSWPVAYDPSKKAAPPEHLKHLVDMSAYAASPASRAAAAAVAEADDGDDDGDEDDEGEDE